MTRPLEGYAILVTRPEEQAHGLIDEIEKQGGLAVFAPMIAIRPLGDTPESRAAIDRLADYHVVIFISRNAADLGMQLIESRDKSLVGRQVYAVGVGTGARLKELGVAGVHTPKGEFSSEGLLKMPGLSAHEIEGKRVLIMRGAGGREVLAHGLQQRGAHVDYCEVYERIVPPQPLGEVLKKYEVSKPDIVCITSLEAVTNLAEKIDQEGLELLYDVPLLVVGARTAHEVERLGFTEPPVVVENPGEQSIVEALIEWVEDER